MPQTLQIACLVHVHSSSVAGGAELTQLLDDVCWPLLRSVEDGAAAPISMHLSGPILSHARAADPHFLVVLKQCIRDGRIELVGGALYDTALPSIPARDALGQLLACANLQEELFGLRPEGAWLSLSAWDPSVIAPLRDADITWTLVDAAAWEAVGWDPWDVHGHYTTERHGRAVSVFPIDDALSSAAHAQDAAGLGASLKRVAGRPQAPLLVSLVLDGEHLVRSCHHTELMSCLRSNQHWLKPRLFCGLRESLPSRGPVYLGQSAWPGLAPWCQPTSSSSSSFDDGEDAAVGPVVWENSLVRYPEANRLHKRMLRVSERVETLRKVLVRQQRKGKNISAAKQLMEKACAGLWRAQGHDVYWHGGRLHLGVYDSTLRSATLRDLLAAEKIVRRLLGGRAPASWEEHLGDYDGDGSDELMVRTSSLQAIVDAPCGGGLLELDLLGPGLALLCGFDPIEEPYHQASSGTEIQLVDPAEDCVADRADPAGPELVPAMDRLGIGRLRRGAFLDHFLGPETSIGSFSRGQYPELGDFASGPFDVLAPEGEGRLGEVTLGRSGVVNLGEERALLRIEKTYRFDLENPSLTLVHRTSNRSRDPASAWFGLEWTFGIPSSKPEGVTLRVQGASGSQSYRLEDGPVELPPATWFEWEDSAAGLAVVIELDLPQALWWMPVRTVAQGPSGWREDIQGNTLLFHGPADIWGDEERRFSMRMGFLSGS